MTRSDIINQIAKKHKDLSRKEIHNLLLIFFDEISQSLQEGRQTSIRGLGTFYLKNRKERTARNPQNGDSVFVAAKKVPAFRYSKSLHNILNNK